MSLSSSLFNSPLTRRPTVTVFRLAASFSLVQRPCLRFAFEMRFRPSSVLAPVDKPPCSRHLPLFLNAGLRHRVPFRVLAKHLFPGQSGPKRVMRPNSEIHFVIVTSAPYMGCFIVTFFFLPFKRCSSVQRRCS